ncbi:hypothetical protein ACC696_38160, partial [Rhizobium ruizarguesonis]
MIEIDGNAVDRDLRLIQEKQYPWDGDISLRFAVERPSRFQLSLRIPGWCRQAQ